MSEPLLLYLVLRLEPLTVECALELELGEKITRMLRETPQLRNGRWLFISATSESDAKDVEELLLAKMRPPRNKYEDHGNDSGPNASGVKRRGH